MPTPPLQCNLETYCWWGRSRGRGQSGQVPYRMCYLCNLTPLCRSRAADRSGNSR
ncbi:hypothetical protein PAMP_008539 [Pampus punctatissimus]